MHKVVFLRHGQSVWNRDHRFTGWTDVELSPEGQLQALRAGRLLKRRGFQFDRCFSSVLQRSTQTLDAVLGELGNEGVEIERSWHLNERHYGALQGVLKADAKRDEDPGQLFRWVRSFGSAPPPLSPEQQQQMWQDPLYADVRREDLPATESLADTLARTLPYWESSIAPSIRAGRKVLVVAHLNSLRALVQHLDGLSDPEVVSLSIHTGEPFVVEFGPDLEPLKRYYLRFQPRLALLRATRRVLRGRKAKKWLSKEAANREA